MHGLFYESSSPQVRAFEAAMYFGTILDGGRRLPDVPGAAIQRLSTKQRLDLESLRASDINNVREETVRMFVDDPHKKVVEELKSDFWLKCGF